MVGESIIPLSLLNLVHSLASFRNDRPSEPINPPTDGANGISWDRLFASTNQIPCDYKCFHEDRTHTMCKYRSSLPGPHCANLLLHNGGLAEEMVNLHNEVRDYVASGWDTDTTPEKLRIHFPQAADMREMVWNEQLAATAQRWAIQCTLYTDSCRDLKLSSNKKYILNKNEIPAQDHMRAKQLVAWKEWDVTYDPPSARQFFNDWLDEVANFSIEDIPAYVKRKRFPDTHFVQIIWSRSYMIGCAMVSFDSRPGFRTIYLVCNYAPGGGQHRWPVYHIGGPCTKCEPLYAEGTDGMICSKKRLSLCQTDFSLSVNMETDRRLLFLLLMTPQIIKSLLSNYYYHFDPRVERTHV